MKEFIKKQTVGTWLTCASFVLALVGFIIYLVNGAAEGYFQGTTNSLVVWMSVLALLCGAGAVVLSLFGFEGLLGKILGLVIDALSILVPVLLMVAFLTFVGDRAQGLAYIFGADANTLSEIQTPANMASASGAIFGFIFYFIAFLCGVVASFFRLPKDVKAADGQAA